MKKEGFTLIELLVVIAIIALLMAIMMPALTKVKEMGRRTVCQANLKQQSLAFNLYLGDNEDYFPSSYVHEDDTLISQVQNCCYTYWNWGGKIGTQIATTDRLLNPYVGKAGSLKEGEEMDYLKVFMCPSDQGAYGGWWGDTGGLDRKPSCWDTMGYSYFYNTSANNNDPIKGLWGKNVNKVNNADKLVLVGDWTTAAYFLNMDPFQYSYWHDRNELGWGNAIYVDHHIQFIQVHRIVLDEPRYTFQNGKDWTFLYNER